MNALLTAIYNKFTAAPVNTLYTALNGRMFTRYAPQGTIFPYAVLDIVSGVSDWTFDYDFDDIDIQFNLFSQSSGETEIGNLLSYLRSLYDDCTLSVSGYTHLFMRYSQYWSLSQPDDSVRQYTVQYRILLLH